MLISQKEMDVSRATRVIILDGRRIKTILTRHI